MASSFRTLSVSEPHLTSDGLHFIAVKTPRLKGRGDLTVYLPEGNHDALPLAILLHGVYGSHWSWTMQGGVHRTARRLTEEKNLRPMALAMPSDGLWGDGSGYLKHGGYDFEQWIVADVPAVVEEVFPQVQPHRAGLFIAGLSMGGFGALRLGAKYPHLFTGFSGHSSITTLSGLGPFVEEEIELYWQADPTEESVVAQMLQNQIHLPPFRFDCGLDDALLADNRTLHGQLLERGIPHSYAEFPGGHEWSYWTEHIVQSLLFFDSLRTEQ